MNRIVTFFRRLRADVKLFVKLLVSILSVPVFILKYLLDLGDKALSGPSIPPRTEGTSPYDHLIMRHHYTPHHYSVGMSTLAGITDEAETPPWMLREEKADGRQVVPSAWVSAANVRLALEKQWEPVVQSKPSLSAHGFLGKLKEQGAYLHGEGPVKVEEVEEVPYPRSVADNLPIEDVPSDKARRQSRLTLADA